MKCNNSSSTKTLQSQRYYYNTLKYNDPIAAVTGIVSQSTHSPATEMQQYIYILPRQQQQLTYYYYKPPNDNNLLQQYCNVIQHASLYLQQ